MDIAMENSFYPLYIDKFLRLYIMPLLAVRQKQGIDHHHFLAPVDL